MIEPKFSLIGAGIGQGVDASHFGNANTYNFTYDLSEGDQSRNVMELGTPVGYFYLTLRIGFLLGMILFSMRIVRSGSTPHALPLALILFAQGFAADLTRAATMTSSQVMIGYAFVLGARLYPDSASLDEPRFDLLTNSR